MRKDYNTLLKTYNDNLKESNQKIFVINLNPQQIQFSNGSIFEGKDRQKWMKMLKSNKSLKHSDDLLNEKITSKDLKKIITSIAGKRSWELKGDVLKEKLKGKTPWNKGLYGEGNPSYGKKLSEESKKRIGLKNSGKNNGMYGKRMTQEQKEYQSNLIKDKILKGEFTPKTNNRLTHFDSTLDGLKYRSSWECLYKYHNPKSIYEKLRIKYNYNGVEKIYIVDFIDEESKTVVEIKPNNILKQKKSKIKLKYLKEWCNNNNYTMIVVNEEWLINNINFSKIEYTRFDENTQRKIKKFYEINKKNRD